MLFNKKFDYRVKDHAPVGKFGKNTVKKALKHCFLFGTEGKNRAFRGSPIYILQ